MPGVDLRNEPQILPKIREVTLMLDRYFPTKYCSTKSEPLTLKPTRKLDAKRLMGDFIAGVNRICDRVLEGCDRVIETVFYEAIYG